MCNTELAWQQCLTCTCSLQSWCVKTPPTERAAEAAAPPPRAPVLATNTLDAALAAAKDAMEAERDAWRAETLQRWKSLRPRGPRVFGATSIHCVVRQNAIVFSTLLLHRSSSHTDLPHRARLPWCTAASPLQLYQQLLREQGSTNAEYTRLSTRAGLPPSWARETGAEQKLPQKLRDQFGDEQQAAGMKIWRRKFLWFPGDHSLRPPFYGSFSRTRYSFCPPCIVPSQQPDNTPVVS